MYFVCKAEKEYDHFILKIFLNTKSVLNPEYNCGTCRCSMETLTFFEYSFKGWRFPCEELVKRIYINIPKEVEAYFPKSFTSLRTQEFSGLNYHNIFDNIPITVSYFNISNYKQLYGESNS